MLPGLVALDWATEGTLTADAAAAPGTRVNSKGLGLGLGGAGQLAASGEGARWSCGVGSLGGKCAASVRACGRGPLRGWNKLCPCGGANPGEPNTPFACVPFCQPRCGVFVAAQLTRPALPARSGPPPQG